MDRSPAHETARAAACRLPALQASLALLVEDTQPAQIALYGTTRPEPGDPPGGAALVVIPLAAAPGTIDAPAFQIQIATPVEGQIDGADDQAGSLAVWARITDGAGGWWADCSVSDNAGTGEIQLESQRLYNGAYCRLTSVIFQG